ncbi:MAG: hypothetical protein IKW57_01660 [Alphaproteobacteria bacterium]|nr:hypothetical protein [Alphaproteobacteria bacterium]
MAKKQISQLTPADQSRQEFMTSLVNILAHSDLSKLDLSTFVGEHNAYSALVDNYEINIGRTPVYAYPKSWNRVLCWGRWDFEPGIHERYEVRIFENPKDMRLRKYVRIFGRENVNFNTVMEYGTMASGDGYYLCTRYERDMVTDADDMFYKQNKHLFVPTKQLYNILDSEYNRRAANATDYKLSDANDKNAIYEKILHTVRNKFLKVKAK